MYDPYSPAVTDSWDWPAQVALWRERALHQAQNAERWRRIAQAAEHGTTNTPAPAGTTNEGH